MGTLRRTLSAVGIGGTAAAIAAASGASWYYATRLTEPPHRLWPPVPLPEDRVTITGLDLRAGPPASAGTSASGGRAGGTIGLRGQGADRPGVWGLAGPEGYGQVSAVRHREPHGVERGFVLFGGAVEIGQSAVMDHFAYPHDPTVLGLPVEEVTYRSPLGDLPAWWWPAGGDVWAIVVHGRNSRRHEALRVVPTLHGLGIDTLAIAYRNDADAPPSPDGHSHLGATEWEDVEGAVRFALARGARVVVPIGFSMGGGCVMHLLRRSQLVSHIAAAVLEAPVLDWGPVIRNAAVQRGLPAGVLPLLLPLSMALARLRAGIDWGAMRHLEDADSLELPKLLIHGVDDATVPVAMADALAAARPDIVTYLRVEGAGHVRAWNRDPGRYEAALRDFLVGVPTLGLRTAFG